MEGMSEERHFREIDLPVYREELAPHLPAKIFDTHVHLLRRSDYLPGVDPDKLKTTAPAPLTRDFTYDHLDAAMRRLFPEQQWEALIFHNPTRDIDLAAGNRWIASVAREHSDVHPLMIVTPEMKAAEVEAQVRQGGFIGLKPYEGLGPKPVRGETRIADFLTADHMAVADALGLIVILHVPRKGRIGDPVNIRDVAELCARWRNARIILAHIGRSYGPWFIEQAIGTFKDLPNLHYDVAALDDAETIEVVLENVPHTRLHFASDLPVTLLRGRHMCVNRHCFFLTEEPCPNSITPPKGAAFPMTFMLYETVRALLRACRKRKLSKAAVEGVFHDNAVAVVQNIGRKLT